MNIKDFLRTDFFPNVWCAGCGNGIVLRSTLEAIKSLDISKDEIAMVSGIGCSSRATGYVDFHTIHSLHGRAIPVAVGVRAAKPNMKVFVMTGDGDCSSIGGNHLIHAARRNIDLTVIVFNNNIYGMTGGQVSPTTPYGSRTTTTPSGNPEKSFDICSLVMGAGATYVARGTVYHVHQLIKLIKEAINHKGFSLIDVVTPCPVYYGRMNRYEDGIAMMKEIKEKAVTVEKALSLNEKDLEGKIVIGLLKKEEKDEFLQTYLSFYNTRKEAKSDTAI
ncbi:MAG: 2-oxoglutarate oxidoreductase subunit KorB [candidate division WS2 bacterium]|nr:2-oxoglutarate oxidoreductase subunit KorB [Candidatus Lithacetigena glycinireducens]